MVNFAMKVAACMYVCLVFIEVLTGTEGKTVLVLLCDKVPVLCASIVLFKKILSI